MQRGILLSSLSSLFALFLIVSAAFSTKEQTTVPDVALEDVSGKSVQLHDLKKKGVVVAFLSFECPMSNGYSETLGDLHKKYAEKDIAFYGICINEDLSNKEIAQKAKEFKLGFPVCKDATLAIAKAFGARVTPEVFLLDGTSNVLYRGRIDDRYSARLKKNREVTSHDLRNAIEEFLEGKKISKPRAEAFGCSICREEAAPKKDAKVTYHRDVERILQNQCQTCHRPGEAGPFSLMTYKQAKNWGNDIKEFTQSRKMPPWKPTDGVKFVHERTMSDEEIKTLAAWVDAGMPQGDAKDAPAPRKFVKGWQLGEPDLILKPDGDMHVGADGKDLFRCFVLPTNFEEDRYVTAIEVRPSNNRIVHHALMFTDARGEGRKLEKKHQESQKKTDKDHGPGYTVSMGVGFLPTGGMGGWAPGQVPRHLPADTGYVLPKGADVVLQIHYHRNGREEDDRTQIGLYFSKKPVSKRYQMVVLPGRFLAVPAGEENFKVTGELTVKQDCELHSIMPHMHMLGRKIKVSMKVPDGEWKTLLVIDDWDYNWQETYFLKDPIKVKAETAFRVEAWYDNSEKNPLNPFNPPRRVVFGEQTTNEMCFVFLGGTTDKPGRIKVKRGKVTEEKPEPPKSE